MKDSTVHILLVDDDEVDTMAVRRAFKKQRIANPLYTARNGIEALETLRGPNGPHAIRKPYLILLDLNMPQMNGIEFLQELRRDPEHKEAIVFVLTTSDAEEDVAQAYGLNVAGYIVKSRITSDFFDVVSMLSAYWRIVELPGE